MTWAEVDHRRLHRQADRRRRWGRFGLYVGAISFAFLAAFPFSWAAISMFKQSSDLYVKGNNPFWFNEAPTLRHVELLFAQTHYLTFLRNTVLVGLAVTAI